MLGIAGSTCEVEATAVEHAVGKFSHWMILITNYNVVIVSEIVL